MYRNTILLVVGFLLFFFGFLSLVLVLIGMRFSFLSWIDHFGPGVGFAIRLFMIFGGVVMMYVSRTRFEK